MTRLLVLLVLSYIVGRFVPEPRPRRRLPLPPPTITIESGPVRLLLPGPR